MTSDTTSATAASIAAPSTPKPKVEVYDFAVIPSEASPHRGLMMVMADMPVTDTASKEARVIEYVARTDFELKGDELVLHNFGFQPVFDDKLDYRYRPGIRGTMGFLRATLPDIKEAFPEAKSMRILALRATAGFSGKANKNRDFTVSLIDRTR